MIKKIFYISAVTLLYYSSALGVELQDLQKDYFDPKSLPAYTHELKPILQKWDTEIPKIEWALTRMTVGKNWIWTRSPITDQECKNGSIIRTSSEVVACQSYNQILVLKSWFDKVSRKNQAGLILHEYLVGHVLAKIQELLNLSLILNTEVENKRLVFESRVRQLVRTFFSDTQDASELVKIFQEITLFEGTIFLRENIDKQIDYLKNDMEPHLKTFCANPYESINGSNGPSYIGLSKLLKIYNERIYKDLSLYQYDDSKVLSRFIYYAELYGNTAEYSRDMVGYFLNVVFKDPMLALIGMTCR